MTCSILLALLSGCISQTAPPVEYEISFKNAVHHEARITATFREIPGERLELVMSRSSPGRYAIHDFAKNVYGFEVLDGKGRSLAVDHPNPHEWHVAHKAGPVTINYTLYGDRLDGTYTAIDETHAHLNIPATFIWARGLEDRPIELKIHLEQKDWTVATQLPPGKSKNTFVAPDLDYFIDSPIEIGPLIWREWDMPGPTGTQQFRLAVHHAGTNEAVDVYAAMIRRVITEEVKLFGELPAFDYGSYTFIADYLPYAVGDGMEHRNSTILTSTRTLEEESAKVIVTLAHELVHAWSMERLRSRAIEPFNLESGNPSGELWFGEGFTSYYHRLIVHRAGLSTVDELAASISEPLNFILNSPGQNYFSPTGMSQLATFFDDGSYLDPTNEKNTFITYYACGAGLGLSLDLMLRRNHGISLDDYMRAMWRKFGAPELPYTSDDLKSVLAEVTSNPTFAENFFETYVFGKEPPPYAELLELAGLKLRQAKQGRASIGNEELSFSDAGAKIEGPTLIGSPLYTAGLDRGTVITELDSRSLTSAEVLDSILAEHKPGDTLSIRYESRSGKMDETLRVTEDSTLEVVPYEHEQLPVTPEIRAFRRAWLGEQEAMFNDGLVRDCPKCKRNYSTQNAFCPVDGMQLKFALREHARRP